MFRRLSLYLLLLVNFAIIFYFWGANSGTLLFKSYASFFLALGRITGLLAVFFILLQLILIGRVVWVEKIFGLDKLSVVHHWVGTFIPVFVLAHPIFLSFAYALPQKISFWAQSWEFITGWELLSAYVSALLFLLIITTSIYIVFSKKLKYEAWFYVHLTVYLAIILAFEHQLEMGGDFFSDKLFVTYWYLIYFVAVGNLILFRFLRPAFYFYQHRFQVEKIIAENSTTWSIYITGKNLAKFKFQPGQFAIWRFLDKKNWWQAHPFSFSSVPNEKYLRITVKNLGDFTSQINKIKPGTYVIIDGPSGIFTSQRTNNNKLLLIAGGVGITPIRPLFEHLQSQNKDIFLLFGNRVQEEIIFKEELEALCVQNGKICHVISGGSWAGEKGYIDEEKINRLVPDFLERDVYVCGPPVMMKKVISDLVRLGIKKNKIYFEKFSLGS